MASDRAAAVGAVVPARWATATRSRLVAASAHAATSQGSGHELGENEEEGLDSALVVQSYSIQFTSPERRAAVRAAASGIDLITSLSSLGAPRQ